MDWSVVDDCGLGINVDYSAQTELRDDHLCSDWLYDIHEHSSLEIAIRSPFSQIGKPHNSTLSTYNILD